MSDGKCIYDPEQKLWFTNRREEIFNENVSAGELAFFMMRNKNPSDIMQISDLEGTTLTYGTALTTAIRIAQHLEKLKLSEEDIVTIFAPNTTYVMPVAVASWFNGCPFLAMNTATETYICEQIFANIEPKIIFCDGLHYEKLKKATAAFNPKIYTIFNHLENVPKIEELLEPTQSERYFRPKPLRRGPNQTMVLVLSSGTTGLPKSICLSNRYVITDFSLFYQNDTIMSTSGADWLSGLCTLFVNLLIGGTRVISHKPFTAEYLLELIAKHKVSVLYTNPAYAIELTSLPNFTKESMKSIRMIIMGGTPCPDQVLKRFRGSLTEDATLYFGYASTETGIVSLNGQGRKIKSVGKLIPNIEMKIVDTNTGERLGPNEVGEMCIRNYKQEFVGYFKNPEANKKAIDSEGFIHTGDLGFMDDEYDLFLAGRCAEVMKHLGFKWSPSEIECVIEEIPDVVEVCVFGVFDYTKLDEPAAAVVKKPGSSLTEKEVEVYVEHNCEAFYKRLNAGVFFLKELPRNRNGKFLRDKIKEICLAMKEKQTLEG